MDRTLRNLLDSQQWGPIVKKLTLHAKSRLKFWGLLRDKGIKGKSPEDIAIDAICEVYEEIWNWDPKKSDILTYLKFHVVNGMVANLYKSKEVKKSSTTEDFDLENDFNIEDEINAEQIIKLMQVQLKDELSLLNIFNLLVKGLVRQQICEILEINEKTYNNSLRKLKTRLLKFKEAIENKSL